MTTDLTISSGPHSLPLS